MRQLSIFILIISLISACSTGNQNSNMEQQNVQDGSYHLENYSLNAHAEHLEKLAERIPQVHHATCVILGPIAIVGIDVDGKLEREKVDTIKYSVAETLRNDPLGLQAVVTADIDMYQRLVEIREHARNGRPIAGFANELADMIGRIMPQLSNETIPQTEHPDERIESSQ